MKPYSLLRYHFIVLYILSLCLAEYCPHDVNDYIPGTKMTINTETYCIGYIDLPFIIKGGLETAAEACHFVFNGTVLPPTSQLTKLLPIRQKKIGRTFITSPVDPDFIFLRTVDPEYVEINVRNDIFGNETIKVPKLAHEWLNEAKTAKAQTCLVYKFLDKKTAIEKAISCEHRSFNGVVCFGKPLLKCAAVLKNERACNCTDDLLYHDKFCLRGKDPCKTKNPCRHQGSCLMITGKQYCHCHQSKRYSGKFCEIDKNPCTNVNCHDGRCRIVHNHHYCQCNKGYEGEDCTTKTDWCKSVYCEGGGQCNTGESDYFCQCTSNRTGRNCEALIQEPKLSKPVIVGIVGGGTFILFLVAAICVLTQRRKIRIRRKGGSPLDTTSIYGKPLWQSLMESTKYDTTVASKTPSKGTSSSTTQTKTKPGSKSTGKITGTKSSKGQGHASV